MYSQIQLPPGVRNLRVRPGHRTLDAWSCGHLVADRCGDTWFVYHRDTLLVEAVFHDTPNTHGWSPSEAHAKSYINRGCPVNPFELDTIP